MKRTTLLMAACVSASTISCREGFDPASYRVVTLRLIPRVLDVAADGGQAAFLIEGHAADGRTLEPAPFVMLLVRDTTVATVSGPGLVTGQRAGMTYIVAVGGPGGIARDSVLVRVRQFSAHE